MYIKNGKPQVSWGDGESDLFLQISKELELLDYEFDTRRLHEMCGGENVYCSCSGYSGAGYFTSLGSLLPLGSYRIDTAYNDFQHFLPIGKIGKGEEIEVKLAVPYASHMESKSEILRKYPAVLKFGNTIVYCDFGRNLLSLLRTLLTGGDLPEEDEVDGYINNRVHRTLRKTFSRIRSWGPQEEEVVVEFYNLCSMDDTPNPWEFFQEELKVYRSGEQERIFQLLAVEKLSDSFVRTMKIDGIRYRGKILGDNPLTNSLTAGWQRIADDVIVRFYDKSGEAHLVAYASAQEAYGKLARRLANRMGESEEFISFVSSHDGEYVEFELTVSKALFMLDGAAQVAEVRRGLARKVRKDVTDRARQWIRDVNDQAILEAIPDGMVIMFDDSLDAGNCRPGTEAFVARFFPGQTQTTAKELKKHADNYNVMRIFRHLAATGRFDWIA